MNCMRNFGRAHLLFTAAIILLLIVPVLYLYQLDRVPAYQEPLLVLQPYLKAIYARDFEEAYRYISLEDRKVRDKESYVQEKDAYSGFPLQLAKQLAEGMEIAVLAREQTSHRARLKVRFKVPAPEDLSSRVLNWDSEKLNTLSPTQQRELLEALGKLRRDGKLIMVGAEETFELIKEGDDWRLFFDWAAGVKVAFDFSAPPSSGVEAQFSEQQIITKIGEPFQIVFKITNRSSHAVAMKIGHLIQPHAIRDHVEMIQCGLLSPMTLPPGSEQEMSSIYILTGEFPDNVKDIQINYAFNPEK
jgi:hypothetical protein